MMPRPKWIVATTFAWVLWMDQTVYTHSTSASGTTGTEGSTSRWEQLDVAPTKAACQAVRQKRIVEELQREPAREGRRSYPIQNRLFCAPVAEHDQD
jgi:hypothetical protein